VTVYESAHTGLICGVCK